VAVEKLSFGFKRRCALRVPLLAIWVVSLLPDDISARIGSKRFDSVSGVVVLVLPDSIFASSALKALVEQTLR
jgi:hypothetical protein